jgi:hypothetical protein
MPSHHPAKESIWKTEIKSLANSKFQAKAPMLALTKASSYFDGLKIWKEHAEMFDAEA